MSANVPACAVCGWLVDESGCGCDIGKTHFPLMEGNTYRRWSMDKQEIGWAAFHPSWEPDDSRYVTADTRAALVFEIDAWFEENRPASGMQLREDGSPAEAEGLQPDPKGDAQPQPKDSTNG